MSLLLPPQNKVLLASPILLLCSQFNFATHY
jgi:hypothetical protein